MGCEVKSGMEERQTKSAERKEACRRLKQLAAARGNDAVKLAFLQPEQWQEIDGMDLTALKEFKRSPNGVVEIKLLDRVERSELSVSKYCLARGVSLGSEG